VAARWGSTGIPSCGTYFGHYTTLVYQAQTDDRR
jgi:hypothetical protein